MNYKFNSGGQFSGVSPALVYKSPPAQYAYNWSGIYLGSDGGFGWETAKGTLTDATGAPLTSYNYRASGPLAGLFAGGKLRSCLVLKAIGNGPIWSATIRHLHRSEPPALSRPDLLRSRQR
jgi:hypothetical protein